MISTKNFLLFLVPVFLLASAFYVENVHAVLQKHFEAIGEQTLQQIQGVHVKGRLQLATGGDLYFKMYVKNDDRLRVEWSGGGATWVEVYKGKSGWSNRTGQFGLLGGQDLYNLQWLARFMSPLRSLGKQKVLLTESTVEGEKFHNLSIEKSGSSHEEYLVDKTSFLLAYQRLSVTGPSDLVPQEISYEKYKSVGDAKVPTIFLIKTNDGSGEVIKEMIFDDLVFGYPVPDSLFEL